MSEVIQELMIEWCRQNSDVLTELIEPEDETPRTKGKKDK